MHDYPAPPFRDTLTSAFMYAAWSIDPVRIGPFVRPSSIRRMRMDMLGALAHEVEQRDDVESVRVLEASFIPPLSGVPKRDVVMLVRTSSVSAAQAICRSSLLDDTEPAVTFVATNAARFGDTEHPASGVNILLNHFTGPPDRPAAAEAWRQISRWYVAKAGVDNSTLLRTEEGAPYVVVNYVRIPGKVVPFMLQQVARPSFYRYVRRLLKQHRLTPLPVFFRPASLEATDD
ncbi:hypothetical protein ACRCUN_08015 [Mycobacterium sp. LTG2003]